VYAPALLCVLYDWLIVSGIMLGAEFKLQTSSVRYFSISFVVVTRGSKYFLRHNLLKHFRFIRQQYTYELGNINRYSGELRAGRPSNRRSISSRCNRHSYSLVHSVKTGNDAHLIYPIVTKDSFLEAKLSECEADHSPPLVSSYTCTLPYVLMD
jgi:hypothetical protein